MIYRVDTRGLGCCSKTKQKGRREVLPQMTREPTRPDAGAGDGDPRPSRPPAETTVSSPGVDGLSMRRLSDAPCRDRVMLYPHVATRPQDVGAEFAFHCRHQLAQLTRASAMRRSSDGFSLATTWKRYVPAAAGKRVPRGLSGEAWTPRVGHSIIGIPVVAEKHCCAM